VGRGRAVQVDPMTPKLKPPETKRLKLEYDGLLSNYGLKFNLRRCTGVRCRYWSGHAYLLPSFVMRPDAAAHRARMSAAGAYTRSLLSST
jgi:hypothetical protein